MSPDTAPATASNTVAGDVPPGFETGPSVGIKKPVATFLVDGVGAKVDDVAAVEGAKASE
jgi:hypothetical protein